MRTILIFEKNKILGKQFPVCVSYLFAKYEGESISNQPIPFAMDRDGHDFHTLFQYTCMFYTWVQNCTRIESFFNKILNVKHG